MGAKAKKKIKKQTMSVVAVDEETKTAIETQLKSDMDLLAGLLQLSEGLELNSDLGGFVIPAEWVEGINELAASAASIAGQVTGAPEAAAPEPEGVEGQADDPEEDELGGDTGRDEEDTLFEEEEDIEESKKAGHLDEEDERKVAKLAKRVNLIGKNQSSQLKALGEIARVVKGISERMGIAKADTPEGTERVANGPEGRPVITLLGGKLPIDINPDDLRDPRARRKAMEKRITEFTGGDADEDATATGTDGPGRVIQIPDDDD